MVNSSIAQTGTQLVKERPFTGKIKRCDTWRQLPTRHANLRRCRSDASVEMTVQQPSGQMTRLFRCEACAAELRQALTGNVTSKPVPEKVETAAERNQRLAARKTPLWMERAGKVKTAEEIEEEKRLAPYRSHRNLTRAARVQEQAKRNRVLAANRRKRELVLDEVNEALFG